MLDIYPRHSGDATTSFLTANAWHSGGDVVVSVAGELDLSSAPAFQREVLALFALPVGRVTLDLAGLTFMDSSGLNVLNRVRSAAADHGVVLALRCVPDEVRRVFDVTDMTGLFTIE